MNISAKLALIGLSSIVFFSGCTKHSGNLTLNESGIEYVYKPSEKPGIAAEFNGEEVAETQLMSQAPALEELMKVEDEVITALLYKKAMDDNSADLAAGKKITVVSFKPETKKPLNQILAHVGAVPNKNVFLSYGKPTGDETVVGVINNENVTLNDLNTSNFRYYGLKRRQFREKLARLQGIVVRRALLKAATDDKMNIEEFIKKNIITTPVTVDQKDISDFMRKNNIAEGDADDNLKEKLKQIVEEKKSNQMIEDYVSRKLVKDPVIIHFAPPSAVASVNPNMTVAWGYNNAPINIAMYCDFLNQPCQQFGKDMIKIREKFDGQLKIAFNHFFNENDRNARMIAEASMCAYAQKPHLFGKMFDEYVMKDQGPDEQVIYDTVTRVGGNLDEFKKCFLARTYQQLVTDHLKYAAAIGVAYAPTIMVDDEVVEGITKYEDLERLFSRKVAQKGDNWFKAFFRKIFG
jgi:protein-disulfide isomerase